MGHLWQPLQKQKRQMSIYEFNYPHSEHYLVFPMSKYLLGSFFNIDVLLKDKPLKVSNYYFSFDVSCSSNNILIIIVTILVYILMSLNGYILCFQF